MSECRKTKITKKIFHEVLLELLSEKTLNKISVAEICRRADLNRSTFYAHYEDITFLVREIENEFIDCIQYDRLVNNPGASAEAELLFLKDNIDKFQLLINKGNLAEVLIERAFHGIFKDKSLSKEEKEKKKIAISYTIAGFLYVADYWLKNSEKIDVTEMAKILSEYGQAVTQMK